MNTGDRVKFPFKGEEREGTVVRVCEKAVWLRADFAHHPGKLVRRKIHEIGGGTAGSEGGGLRERLRRRLSGASKAKAKAKGKAKTQESGKKAE